MKTLLVHIVGDTPLLMANPQAMMTQENLRNKGKKYDPSEEAEKTAYRDTKGILYIPSRCMRACITGASKKFKIKGSSLSKVIAGTIRIEPMEISLKKKEYEIYSARMVIQRQAVIKHRAMLRDWEATFQILYDEEWFPNAKETLEKVIPAAGKLVGLLDYRPEKNGGFGTFSLKSIKEKE